MWFGLSSFVSLRSRSELGREGYEKEIEVGPSLKENVLITLTRLFPTGQVSRLSCGYKIKVNTVTGRTLRTLSDLRGHVLEESVHYLNCRQTKIRPSIGRFFETYFTQTCNMSKNVTNGYITGSFYRNVFSVPLLAQSSVNKGEEVV